jgi:hypothetical protein
MSCGNPRSSKCNPCGPSEAAMNAIAEKAAYYARMAQYASDGFSQVYLGAKDTAPTTDNNGNPLVEGALYFNTVTELLYAWDGAAWVSAIVGTNTATTDTAQTITGAKTFTQPIVGNVTGNVSGSASTLAPGNTIAISGAVTGTATSFNGGAAISIPAIITSGATITSPNLAGTATGSLISTVLQGITDGVAASTGFVGEIISSTIAVGSAVTLTSGTTSDVTSISLTAGEWYVNGQVDYRAASSTSITILTQGVSSTSATLGGQDTFSRNVSAAFVPTASNDVGLPVRGQAISLTATTTIYLVANATFSANTLSAYGTLQARRVR